MSVLGTIISRVFGRDDKKAAPAAAAPRPAAVPTPAAAPVAAAPTIPAPAASNRAAAEAVLEQLAAENPQKLDWRHSIVDLMKLVHMDSTLAERRELAGELGYTGDTNDTAKMNVWLHEQVMNKLAENGGGVAANLLNG